jgi:1,4-alpha-glucan branching enzyme
MAADGHETDKTLKGYEMTDQKTTEQKPKTEQQTSEDATEPTTPPADPAADSAPTPTPPVDTTADPAAEPTPALTTQPAPDFSEIAAKVKRVPKKVSLLTDDDIHYFNEGTHFRLYEKLGAHPLIIDDVAGTYFAVWAPNAESVAIIGDFNEWDATRHPLHPRGSSGIWEGFIGGMSSGTLYKYHVASRFNAFTADKTDPFANHNETPPKTASVVWDMDYTWGDDEWMATRYQRNALDAPVSIYEMHLGSWMRGEDNRVLSYRELAPRLVEYLQTTQFTHVEFLPVMEHPFYGSWGYQTIGYFAPTSRYGTPQDFMYLIDQLHQNGIGVILDWVPSHFPSDGHGLAYFDGTHLYEHEDSRKGWHPDWNSYIFNYGRHEVRSFLISSAFSWLDRYHIDGLRVDAVASMLYLDYSRKAGEWIPNQYGGNENLEAIYFLRRLNEEVYRNFPDVQTIAEESTSWPMVSRPLYLGGLGFGMKWDMGWMHDTLYYMQRDPVYRRYHHGMLTFRMVYAFNENFCMPLSHDEVVHGKGSLLNKMPGDYWQKVANLRMLFGYMYAQPGKKLIFMGGDIAQWSEWKHDYSLDWHLVDEGPFAHFHRGMQNWLADLNIVYRREPALYELDCSSSGFEWIDANDADQSVITFLRKGTSTDTLVAVACNMTPVPREGYYIGVPRGGYWREVLNSDADRYGGSNVGNMGGVEAVPHQTHGRPYCLKVTLPPLGAVFLINERPRLPAPETDADAAAHETPIPTTNTGTAAEGAPTSTSE